MQTPILQSILVADRIYEDKATRKKIIAGVFGRIFRLRKDLVEKKVIDESTGKESTLIAGGTNAGSPFAYLSLTEILGEADFELRYVCLENDVVVFQTFFRIASDDPIETFEIVMPLPNLPTENVGVFALELLFNNVTLGLVRITVADAPSTGELDNGND